MTESGGGDRRARTAGGILGRNRQSGGVWFGRRVLGSIDVALGPIGEGVSAIDEICLTSTRRIAARDDLTCGAAGEKIVGRVVILWLVNWVGWRV